MKKLLLILLLASSAFGNPITIDTTHITQFTSSSANPINGGRDAMVLLSTRGYIMWWSDNATRFYLSHDSSVTQSWSYIPSASLTNHVQMTVGDNDTIYAGYGGNNLSVTMIDNGSGVTLVNSDATARTNETVRALVDLPGDNDSVIAILGNDGGTDWNNYFLVSNDGGDTFGADTSGQMIHDNSGATNSVRVAVARDDETAHMAFFKTEGSRDSVIWYSFNRATQVFDNIGCPLYNDSAGRFSRNFAITYVDDTLQVASVISHTNSDTTYLYWNSKHEDSSSWYGMDSLNLGSGYTAGGSNLYGLHLIDIDSTDELVVAYQRHNGQTNDSSYIYMRLYDEPTNTWGEEHRITTYNRTLSGGALFASCKKTPVNHGRTFYIYYEGYNTGTASLNTVMTKVTYSLIPTESSVTISSDVTIQGDVTIQ